jgi:hypothetical protein
MPTNERLILYVEQAYKLKTNSFWLWLNTKPLKTNYEKVFLGDWLAHDGLNHEGLDAFCLRLRILIQKRDMLHAEKMIEESKKWGSKFNHLKEAMELSYLERERVLNSRCLVSIFKNKNTTNRDLFDIIFYGGIAHLNEEKRVLFKDITTSGMFSYFVFSCFKNTLFCHMNCIQSIAHSIVQYTNKKE